METNNNNTIIIPGDYQYKAIEEGPISQRLWHLSKQELMEDYLTGKYFKKICDAGCGSGVIAGKVKRLSPDSTIFAYDNNQECIEFASETFQNVSFKMANLMDLTTLQERNFDFIYSMEVIEHFNNAEIGMFLDSLYDLGCENAKYLITTPDYQSLWPVIECLLDTLNLAPKMDNYQHLSKFSKKTLVQTVEKHKFKVDKIYNFCGMSPFSAHLSLTFSEGVKTFEKRYKLGNLICCEFTRG